MSDTSKFDVREIIRKSGKNNWDREKKLQNIKPDYAVLGVYSLRAVYSLDILKQSVSRDFEI